MLKYFFKAIVIAVSDICETKFECGERIEKRYEVQKCLGKGSYGISYLVFDHQNDIQVVLKTLRLHKRLTKKGRKAFEQEFNLLGNLKHPGYPQVFEQSIYNQIPYFTMEYINGKTFEQLIFQEGKVYGEKEAFQIGLELFSLISNLHQKGIIHRDVRIPNVMVVGNELKLIDFGLAKYEEESWSVSHLKDVRKLATPLSDYYALGHFLLFLLYSQYEIREKTKEKSWEEELDISMDGKNVIKRLLLTSYPYENAEEVKNDFIRVITRR